MMMTNVAPSMVFSKFSQGTRKSRVVSSKSKAKVRSLTLSDRASQQTFRFDNTAKSEIIVGRSDKVASYQPTLDLAPVGAYRLGVSRLHISIVIEKDTITIVDLQSANGTYINDTRLIAYKPYSVQKGDVIRLGKLILDVTLA